MNNDDYFTSSWSRNRAIAYMEEHTPLARGAIETEIDRYITWPGQACAYKIGELKIRELREHAKTELGMSIHLISLSHCH